MLVGNQLFLRRKVDAGIARVAYWGVSDDEAHLACPDHSKSLDYLGRARAPNDAVVNHYHMFVLNHFANRYYALVYLDPVALVWLYETPHRTLLLYLSLSRPSSNDSPSSCA